MCVYFGAEVGFSGDADECRGRDIRGVIIMEVNGLKNIIFDPTGKKN